MRDLTKDSSTSQVTRQVLELYDTSLIFENKKVYTRCNRKFDMHLWSLTW